jgi:hypothetical protein
MVSARIETLKARQAAIADLSAAKVLTELSRIAFADPAGMFAPDGNILPISEMPEDIRHTLTEFQVSSRGVKVKQASKLDALGILAKHLGIVSPVETAVQVNVTVTGEGATDPALEAFTVEELHALRDAMRQKALGPSAETTAGV